MGLLLAVVNFLCSYRIQRICSYAHNRSKDRRVLSLYLAAVNMTGDKRIPRNPAKPPQGVTILLNSPSGHFTGSRRQFTALLGEVANRIAILNRSKQQESFASSGQI
jgi:hypothetical protein